MRGSLRGRRSQGWTRGQIRESLLANKEVIDRMLYLAGAPLEAWESMHVTSFKSPLLPDPPEITMGWSSPFKELPEAGWSRKDLQKCLGYIEGQIEYLVALLTVAFPKEGCEEHRRARWAAIRLRVLLQKLRTGLFTSAYP